jgi:hypothetical protein
LTVSVEKIWPLWNLRDTHPHDLFSGDAHDALSLVQDITAIGPEQAGNRAQGGGLARPIGADQRDDLSCIDVEGDALNGADRAICHMQVIDLK